MMEFFLEYPMLVTYLFLKLDSLVALLHSSFVVALIVLGGRVFFFALEHQEVAPKLRQHIAIILAIALIGLSIPSSKEVAIMYGVSTGVTVGKSMANSPIANKSLELLNIYVEKELDKAKNSLEKSK